MSTDWLLAACREAETHLWFPISYNKAQDRKDAAEAKRICHDCPLEQVCLEQAMKDEYGQRQRHGIFGGLDETERHNLARRMSAGKGRTLSPHGTNAAWKRHKAHGEPICDLCKPAHTYKKAS